MNKCMRCGMRRVFRNFVGIIIYQTNCSREENPGGNVPFSKSVGSTCTHIRPHALVVEGGSTSLRNIFLREVDG